MDPHRLGSWLLSQDLRPWLIELNPGPAMGIDQRVPRVFWFRVILVSSLKKLVAILCNFMRNLVLYFMSKASWAMFG